ncbi:MAG: carboxypeptidase-like regulatory domain-containing protein [Myxococcota bacterium]
MRLFLLPLLLAPASCIMDGGLNDLTEVESPLDPEEPGGGVATDPFKDMGHVTGRICGTNGSSWVGGATVWIEEPTGKIVNAFTNVDGEFALLGVTPGIHTVRVMKGSFNRVFQVEVFANITTALPVDECLEQGDLRLAVVTGEFDRIQDILGRMDLEYDLVKGLESTDHVDFLLDLEAMSRYDILFLNCGMDEVWWDLKDPIGQNIRSYLEGGGSVYTSDMTYAVMEAAYPDAMDFVGRDDILFHPNQLVGAAVVTGNVVDKELERSLGSETVVVNYESDGLYAAGQAVGTATELITGSFNNYNRDSGTTYWNTGVLAARQDVGPGRIIFTSFHNEAQSPASMDALLEALVLTL